MRTPPNFSANAPGLRVFATSAYPDPEPLAAFLAFARRDKIKRHVLVADPAAADLILFVENSRYHADPYFTDLKRHALVQKFPGKAYMYNAHDVPWHVLPGLYASMPAQRFHRARMAACPYLETVNPHIRHEPRRAPEFLFSFNGALSAPVRRRVAQLAHPRGKVLVSTRGMYTPLKPQDALLQYAELCANSKFVLCPRGVGTSSVRLFETMQAGRVPVILSDDWVPPLGPDWPAFALFVPEDRVADVPALLEAEERHWPEKAALARRAWEEFFAPDTIFHYFVTSLAALDGTADFPLHAQAAHFSAFAQYACRKLARQHLKPYLEPLLSRWAK